MHISIEKSGRFDEFRRMVKQVESRDDVASLLLLVCEENNFSTRDLNVLLKTVTKPVLGGIFPALISGPALMQHGAIVAGIKKKATVHVLSGLSNNNINFESALDSLVSEDTAPQTLFVFVDGIATRLSAFVDALYAIFGLTLNYVGGGAGSSRFVSCNCILTNQGALADSALIAEFDMPSCLGVRHGFLPIEGPFKVTEASQTMVSSINWVPASQLYQQIIENHLGKSIEPKHIAYAVKSYPLGIDRLSGERIVRDPVCMQEDGSMVFIGEVPEGVYVDVLHGDKASLVAAAAMAKNDCLEHLAKREQDGLYAQHIDWFFMDCISRAHILCDSFYQELNAIYSPGMQLIGALTLGEIANCGRDYLEFYNKTAVLAALIDA